MERSAHLSVIIPVFNEENFIIPCLDALARQTVQPDVIYVIDNNCSDATVRFTKKYSNVTVIRQSVQGICATTQKGFDYAARHSGIMLRCDADSRPSADWVENIVDLFEHNDDVISVTGPGVAYDTSVIKKSLISWLYMKPYFLFVGLATGQKPLFGSNMAITASAWKQISPHTHLQNHQNIHDDIDISFHVSKIGKILFFPSLKMPISARPFGSVVKLNKRYVAGFRSIFMHWPELAPWQKYKKKILAKLH